MAAENDVQLLLVHVKRLGCERRDGVHNQESAKFVSDFTKWIELGDDAGGSFTVRQPNDFDLLASASFANIFGIHSRAIWRFHFDDFGRRTQRDFVHPLGEPAVDANDGFIACFERVQHRCFDPAGNR